MRAVIITDVSDTVAEADAETKLIEYYQGKFLVIKSLQEALEKRVDTTIWLITGDQRVISGEVTIGDANLDNDDTNRRSQVDIERSRKRVFEQVTDAEIVVIALRTSTFDNIITPQWSKILEEAKRNGIWCVGVAQSVLNNLDFEPLESRGCRILTYRRVGVAPLNKETRKQFLKAVDRNA